MGCALLLIIVGAAAKSTDDFDTSSSEQQTVYEFELRNPEQAFHSAWHKLTSEFGSDG